MSDSVPGIGEEKGRTWENNANINILETCKVITGVFKMAQNTVYESFESSDGKVATCTSLFTIL